MGGGSSLSLGTGWSFCLWAVVIICGCWALFVHAESLSVCTGSLSMHTWTLFMGTELSLVCSRARSHGWGICGCWFVVCGHGGDMLWAVWSLVSESTLGKRGYLV